MNAYFVRASLNPEGDIKRGFSAVGNYMFGQTEAEALEEAKLMGVDADDLAFHAELGYWVQARAGLCAHDWFDTLEQAREALRNGDVQFVADAGMKDIAPLYIFEGTHTFESSSDDGITFRPTGRFWAVEA